MRSKRASVSSEGTGRVQGGKGMEVSGSGRDSRKIKEGCDKIWAPFLGSPGNFSGPQSRVDNLYLKTEKCIHLTPEISCSVVITFENLLWLSGCENVSGTYKIWVPGLRNECTIRRRGRSNM